MNGVTTLVPIGLILVLVVWILRKTGVVRGNSFLGLPLFFSAVAIIIIALGVVYFFYFALPEIARNSNQTQINPVPAPAVVPVAYVTIEPTRYLPASTSIPTPNAPNDSNLFVPFGVTPVSEFTLYVCVPTANVRLGPGTDFKVYGQITLNKEVKVYGHRADWFYVGRDTGYELYVSSGVLCSTQQTPSQVKPTTPPQPTAFVVEFPTLDAHCSNVIDSPTTRARGIIYPHNEKKYYVYGEGEFTDRIPPNYGEQWFYCAAAAEFAGFVRGHPVGEKQQLPPVLCIPSPGYPCQ